VTVGPMVRYQTRQTPPTNTAEISTPLMASCPTPSAPQFFDQTFPANEKPPTYEEATDGRH